MFENSLYLKSKQIAYLYSNTSNTDQLDKILSNADIINLYDEKVYIIMEDSTLMYSNTSADSASLSQLAILNAYNDSNPQYIYIDSLNFETVVTHFKARNNTYCLINSAVDFLGKDKINNLKSILILGNTFSFFLSLFLGILFSDNILNPMKKIIRQVNDIEGNEFDKRIGEGNGKDELAQLAINFNLMLQRMQEVYLNQKNFISHASHELRTPLANILVNLETTLLYEKDLKTTHKQIAVSILQLKECIELTNGLLQLAYVTKDLVITLEKIRLEELVMEEITILKGKYARQKIGFEILHSIEDDNNPIEVLGNKSLLSTCIKNILENASKYSGQKKINIQLIKKAEHCELKVVDNGIGIPAEEIKHLFEPLYRGSNSHKYHGYGIGLSLVYRIISLHKGNIQILSELNMGTTIALNLPLTID